MSLGKIDNNLIKNAINKGRAEFLKEEIEYVRFKSRFKWIERGTVVAPGQKVIWGFPHIKRIFTLRAGIKRNIHEDFVYFEEKIDGFNVRIAKIDKKIYAFSRGGFLDPFVTEKIQEMKFENFFDDHPDYTLCGEMIGNTPYTRPTDEFDVKLFIFDIDGGNNTYLPCKTKYELLKKYDIECVPVLGRFKVDDFESMERLVNNINKAKKEGVVIKSESRKDVIKYVNPNADIDDIKSCSHIFFDMPFGFFNQRVLRSAFFVREYGLDKEKYGNELGKAFYFGLIKALDTISSGRDVEEEFEILIKNEKTWDEIKKHMGKDVRLNVIYKRKENEKIRIRFSKTYIKTTKLLRSYLNGKGVID